MNLKEFNEARAKSGIYVNENWWRVLRISEDTYKSISSGRLDISDSVASRVRSYIAHATNWSEKLRQTLEDEIKGAHTDACVSLDNATLNITISRPGFKDVVIKNHGVTTMTLWGVFYGPGPTKSNSAVFLRVLLEPWQKTPGKGDEPEYKWFLWSGPFKRGIQYYSNPISIDYLAECFDICK